MIRLAYLPFEEVFAFFVGDLNDAQFHRIEGEPLVFRTRDQALAALKRHNLKLSGDEVVAI